MKEGWMINPDHKIVEAIGKALQRTGGYCPCDNPDKGTKDAKCPCRNFRENDICCCNLFVKKDATAVNNRE